MFCERVNMRVPPQFCLSVCRGNPQKYQRELPTETRLKYRKPLTQKERLNDELVSVIIPLREPDLEYLDWTIESTIDNSIGPIEFIIIYDGFKANGFSPASKNGRELTFRWIQRDEVIGQRAAMNHAAKIAKGKYLLRLDSHCKMSPEWDARMKASCLENRIVVPTFDHLDPESFEPEGRDAGFGRIDAKLDFYFTRPWKRFSDRMTEEETMAFSGGCWMIRKKYYEELGGSDESLGGHGNIGVEWSLKAWLTGGSVIIRTDVTCYHLFRAKLPYPINQKKREWAKKELYRRWVLGDEPTRKKPMEWLIFKFHKYTTRPMLFKRRVCADASI